MLIKVRCCPNHVCRRQKDSSHVEEDQIPAVGDRTEQQQCVQAQVGRFQQYETRVKKVYEYFKQNQNCQV